MLHVQIMQVISIQHYVDSLPMTVNTIQAINKYNEINNYYEIPISLLLASLSLTIYTILQIK